MNTCSTAMIIVLQSGASIQERQKKEIHTKTKRVNSAANKTRTSCTISCKIIFPVSKRRSSKIITAYVDTQKTNQ